MMILEKVSKKYITRSVNKPYGSVIKLSFYSRLVPYTEKVLNTFTDHPFVLFKLDLIYIFDNVKNFIASPALIVLAAI